VDFNPEEELQARIVSPLTWFFIQNKIADHAEMLTELDLASLQTEIKDPQKAALELLIERERIVAKIVALQELAQELEVPQDASTPGDSQPQQQTATSF
jgi:hypothetical protein